MPSTSKMEKFTVDDFKLDALEITDTVEQFRIYSGFSERNMSMLIEQLHCDLSVILADMTIKVHKNVLAGHSIVFK